MHLVTTTPLAVAMAAAILWLGPLRGSVVLFATMPFDTSAAVNLSGLGSITLTDVAVFALLVSLLPRGLKGAELLRNLAPGNFGGPLVLLLVVTAIGAVFLPRALAGTTEVFAFLRREDGGVITLLPLRPTGSNISQSFRMGMSALTFLLMLQVYRRSGDAALAGRAMLAASLAHVALSGADLLGQVLGGNPLMGLRTAMVNVLDNQVLLGVRRLIAGFAEPSAFGAYTIGLYAFWLRLWFGPHAPTHAGVMTVVMAALLIRSTSSAAYVNLILFTAVFLIWQLRSAALFRRSMLVYAALSFALPGLIGGAVLVHTLVPGVAEMVETLLFTKMDSASGHERMGWNRQALVNLVDSVGLGVGIGSTRASGWIFAMLANLGLLGTAIYLWFVARILLARRPFATPRSTASEVMAALQTGAAAIVVQACLLIPYPNLGAPFFAMAGMVAGLAVHLRRESQQGRRPMGRLVQP